MKEDQEFYEVVIIVLGRKLESDFTMSNILLERLKRTKEIFEKENNAFIIASGKGCYPEKTEAQAMKEWLNQNKIEDVIIEEESKNTAENAYLKKKKKI